MIYRHAVFARLPDAEAARALQAELPARGLGQTVSKVLVCDGSDGKGGEQILAGLGNNSTWAESDGRRGLRIGLLFGSTLGIGFGYLLFSVLEMAVAMGVVLGGIMGTAIGALMSGIVGAGLVNPRLRRLVLELQDGEALLLVSSHTRDERDRAARLVEPRSVTYVTDA